MNVQICLITDENYVKPTVVAISSIICNKDINTCCAFHIISKNVTDASKKLIKKFARDDIKIEFIDADDELKEIKEFSHVSKTALLKFRLAEIFNNLDKIIYLDSDIIVQKDLSQLYNIDLKDNYAAVVKDMVGIKAKGLDEVVGVKDYFNSGVMLLNLDLIRKDNLKDKLIKLKLESPKTWTRMDQDVLNYAFGDKTILLEVKYNATVGAFEEFNYSIDDINEFYGSNYSSKTELEDDVIVNHFAGCSRTRPWEYMDGLNSEIWTYYYLLSPFRFVALKRKVYSSLFYPKIRPILKNIFSITNGKNCKYLCVMGLKIKLKR
ncbi:glycosyltransferase family 8 protein [bacterium]|nr:glycosyltransferase family 8 protein [bacterium]